MDTRKLQGSTYKRDHTNSPWQRWQTRHEVASAAQSTLERARKPAPVRLEWDNPNEKRTFSTQRVSLADTWGILQRSAPAHRQRRKSVSPRQLPEPETSRESISDGISQHTTRRPRRPQQRPNQGEQTLTTTTPANKR